MARMQHPALGLGAPTDLKYTRINGLSALALADRTSTR